MFSVIIKFNDSIILYESPTTIEGFLTLERNEVNEWITSLQENLESNNYEGDGLLLPIAEPPNLLDGIQKHLSSYNDINRSQD